MMSFFLVWIGIMMIVSALLCRWFAKFDRDEDDRIDRFR